MATNSTDLFSYLPGIEVSESEILEAELSAQQILKAKFPDIDLREGTALRDLVIRPSATLLALINKSLTFYFAQNDLAGVTNSTPQVFVDRMLSNWFLTRKLGIKSIINVRLYFAKSKPVNIYSDIFFSTDGQIKFNPLSSVTFAATDLTFDAGSNQYYVDTDLIAESPGTQYNITTGSLLYFTNFDAFFLHAEINYLREIAQDIETNSAFIARAKTSISTRNLINVPSIDSSIRDYFSMVAEVKSVGMGDPEMVRDQIKVLVPGVTDPVWIHNGGAIDVYCRVPVASSIIQLTTDANGDVDVVGSIYRLERSLISGGLADDTLPRYVTQVVASITSAGTVATVTTTVAHGYTTGMVITMAGASPAGYNDSYAITVVSPTTFTYTVASGLVSPATGVITAGVPVPFTTKNKFLVTATPTSLTRVGNIVTGTYPNHGLMTGDRVSISGATQPEYNGVFLLTDTPLKDTFTYTISGSPVTPATGTLVLKYVDRIKDYGFSDVQTQTVSFGVGNAAKTVSFVIYYHQNIDGVQAYLTDPSRRVICSDPLAKGFNLTMLDITITGYNGPSPDAGLANTTAIAYLAGLRPGQPFVMSDMVAKLNAVGITTIQTPLGVTYKKYWNDLLGITSGTILDTMNPGDTTNIFMVNSLTTTNAVIV